MLNHGWVVPYANNRHTSLHFLGNQQKSSYLALAYQDSLLLYIFHRLQVQYVLTVGTISEAFQNNFNNIFVPGFL